MADVISTCSENDTSGNTSGGGEWYTTLTTWESAAQTRFGYLSDNCNISGWSTTDAINHPTVRAAAGSENGGVLNAGFTIRIVGIQAAIALNVSYITVQDVQATLWGSGGVGFQIGENSTNNLIERCIAIYDEASEGATLFSDSNIASGNNIVRNCLAINGNLGINPNTGNGNRVENCTAIGGNEGIKVGGANTTVINCVAYDNTTDFPSWSAPSSADKNNASGDTTATDLGIGTVNGVVAGDFVNYQADGTGDYTPSTGGKLDGAGFDNTASGYTDDIAGNTRSVPWEIGAYEIAAAALTFSLSPDSGPLPAGLTVNATTGNIEGTPTEPGTFPNIIIRGTE
jgi:hypothetical protein